MSSGIASTIRRASFLVLASFWATASGLAQTALAADLADLPRVFLDTTYVQPNHGITLEAGATSSGNSTLPAQAGTEWIVIRMSAPDANLPPPGTRITPDYVNVLRKIVTPNSGPAITAAGGAHHYSFVAVEIPVGGPSPLGKLF